MITDDKANKVARVTCDRCGEQVHVLVACQASEADIRQHAWKEWGFYSWKDERGHHDLCRPCAVELSRV